MKLDPDSAGAALADAFVWGLAIAATLVAANCFPAVTALWFIAGYVAHRVMPKPARSGWRSTVFALIGFLVVAVAAYTRSLAPIAWAFAGWAAFAASYQPSK